MIHLPTLLPKILRAIDCQDRITDAVRSHSFCASKMAVLGVGKAAPAMVAGALVALHEQGVTVSAALGITKIGHAPQTTAALETIPVEWVEGEHPMPDLASLRAGEQLLEWIHTRNEKVLVLLSGGASSVVESLQEGVDFETYQREVQGLLLSGASIHELNAYRRSVSALKGGKLGALLGDRLDSVWLVSDVLDDDLNTIASGLCFLPETAERHRIVSSARIELPRLAAIVEQEGYQVEALPLQDRVGPLLETFKGSVSQLQPGQAIIGMGECPITVQGQGLGGRCTYLAHQMAPIIEGREGVQFLAFATDGTDGPTPYAGGFVDAKSISLDRAGWKDADERFDSARWLLQNNLILETGPTGTNINDLYLLWRD